MECLRQSWLRSKTEYYIIYIYIYRVTPPPRSILKGLAIHLLTNYIYIYICIGQLIQNNRHPSNVGHKRLEVPIRNAIEGPICGVSSVEGEK